MPKRRQGKQSLKRDEILSPSAPRQHWLLVRGFGWLVLKLTGWRVEGCLPDVRKLIIIAAPHTSNWDFIIALAAKFYVGLRVRYLMKSEIYFWPINIIWKWSGAIPVKRFEKTDIIDRTVTWMNGEDVAWLGIAPEGTRSRIENWKTGFLRIAKGANVPILLIGFDGTNKTIRFDRVFDPSELDADNIKQAQTMRDYVDATFDGIKPENK